MSGVYLNGEWPHGGGQPRLLNEPDDIDDMIAEVPAVAGTLLAFRRSGNSWHDHLPFEGVRRSFMLNWMTTAGAARREAGRHVVSARFKHLVTAI